MPEVFSTTKKVFCGLVILAVVAGGCFVGMKLLGAAGDAQSVAEVQQVPEREFAEKLHAVLRAHRYPEAAQILRERVNVFRAHRRTESREYRNELAVLGQVDLAIKNYPEAIENYRELFHFFDKSHVPDAAWQKGVAGVALAQAYMLAGDYKAAIEVDKEAINLLPEDPYKMVRTMPEQSASRLDALVDLALSNWTLKNNDDGLKYARMAMHTKEVQNNSNFRKLKEKLIEQAAGFHQDAFVREFASY